MQRRWGCGSHDARHPPLRPRRLLRVGRAARPSRVPRQATNRRRRRPERTRRGDGRVLRGTRLRRPVCDAARDRWTALPGGIYVPGNFDRYVEASDAVMAIFEEQTPLVEPISLDEAFLDVTATEHLFGGAVAMATQIKRAVRERCGLVVSVGVATNKLCAKVGSDLRKPDGLVIVPAGGEAAFLAPLPLERLWGVGPRTREVLAGWDLRTIGQLAAFDRSVLETRLGEHGTDIWARANGIDAGDVQSEHTPKSVGHSHTFDANTLDTAKIESTLLRLAEGVGRRLRDHASAREVKERRRFSGHRSR